MTEAGAAARCHEVPEKPRGGTVLVPCERCGAPVALARVERRPRIVVALWKLRARDVGRPG
jgi:hypothetical protein